ncbi:hypothetical protein H5410_020384, partial [Solanum commersonii]
FVSATPSYETDQEALLAFQNLITSPNHFLANNWTKNASFCSWFGVTCSSKGQWVVALNLPNLQLQGTISPSLANLSFLRELNLENNLFHGLGHLPRLRVINVKNNQLNGSIPTSLFQNCRVQVISLAFNELSGEMWRGQWYVPELRVLNLRNNSLTGIVPPAIGNATKLLNFIFSVNRINGNIPKEIALFNISSLLSVSLGKNSLSGPLLVNKGNILSHLESLSLTHNQISGRIPSNLCQLIQLKILSISFNNITGEIPKNIDCLTKLGEFYIGNNPIDGTIPTSLGNISTLRNLYCLSNSLEGPIPPELGKLSNLIEFNFEQNYNLIGQIPEAIFNISSLKYIALTLNKFSGTIPTSTGLHLPNLLELHLSGNELEGEIPLHITNASKLESLGLSTNFFSGSIPTNLGNLHDLRLLFLQDNQLTSQYELPFFQSLADCRMLQYLDVGYNPLNSILPNSIGNLSSTIEFFEISDAHINGLIPTSIGNMSGLTTLVFQDNSFTGNIPPEFEYGSEGIVSASGDVYSYGIMLMEVLAKRRPTDEEIFNENLGLREWIRRAFPNTMLEVVDANLFPEKEQITSKSEICIASMIELALHCSKETPESRITMKHVVKRLNKIKNAFWEINNMKKHIFILTLLFLVQFSISIASSNETDQEALLAFQNLITSPSHFLANNWTKNTSFCSWFGVTCTPKRQRVVALTLPDLQLQGTISPSLANLSFLSVLNLRNNNFHGGIPYGLGHLPRLRVIDFQNNQLQESIPTSLFQHQRVQIISLAFNKLSGEMWKGPWYVPELTVLNLRNNSLTGIIPPSIGNATKLLNFSLYGNRVGGNIPKEIGNLSQLEFFSLFDNQLTGSIPAALFNISSLLVASLAFNSLSGPFLLDEGNIVSNLESLTISNNQISGYIPSNICQLTELKAFYNNLSGRIPTTTGLHLPNLQELFLGVNKIQGEIPLFISNASMLEILGLNRNFLTGNIPTNLGNLRDLRRLYLEEYGLEGIVSISGDVYSYGIMMMEVLTKRRPTEDEIFNEILGLRQWIRRAFPGAIMEVVDVTLFHEDEHVNFKSEICIASMMELALNCTKEMPESRITMRHIVKRLNKIKNTFLGT